MAVYSPIDIQRTRYKASVYFPIVTVVSALAELAAIVANAEGFLEESPVPTVYNVPAFDNVKTCRIYNDIRGYARIVNTVGNPANVHQQLVYLGHENRTFLNGVTRQCNFTQRQNYTDISLKNLNQIIVQNTIFHHSINAINISPNAIYSPNLAAVNRVFAIMKVRVEYTFE